MCLEGKLFFLTLTVAPLTTKADYPEDAGQIAEIGGDGD